jgi:hypothetical protein
MKSLGENILKYLEKLMGEEEVLEEEGQIAAPATDSSATNDSLPIPTFGKKVARRKNIED